MKLCVMETCTNKLTDEAKTANNDERMMQSEA